MWYEACVCVIGEADVVCVCVSLFPQGHSVCTLAVFQSNVVWQLDGEFASVYHSAGVGYAV